jgi:hypothetical protein
VEERLAAFNAAKDLVAPIVEQHGLDVTKMSAPAFAQASSLTKVDQHISHILDVADWLLGTR